MSQKNKLLISILSGVKDDNMRFADLQKILKFLGFDCRIKGSHHIYYKNGVEEIINIQSLGFKVKA